MRWRWLMAAAGALAAAGTAPAQSFVNFETPQAHPIEMTLDGSRLLVVNTADNRLEVFDLSSGVPVKIGAVPVGLEPTSVRARTSTEVWVVNQLSDSVSIVDLTTMNVVRTLPAGDEPADVIFAGAPQRAFVSVSQENALRVFDPANLGPPPVVVPIAGEDPRALATDGTRVFAAIHDSGNRTTVLSQPTVSNAALNPYPGDANPPPNSGAALDPPIAAGLPAPPPVGLIVEKIGTDWVDDNVGLWTSAVTWDVHDHDVAIVDAASLGVTYATGLMNANMALSVHPAGDVFVVGTEATNVVRFEPNVRATFVRVNMASFDPAAPAVPLVTDLNTHLTYAAQSIPAPDREQSLGDPRAIAWASDGSRALITGMGSNNVIAIDSGGVRLDRADVGQGPTGVALDEPRAQVYVLNRFEASISVLSESTLDELVRISFFDPTPQNIRDGRPFLYDTHRTSGLGQASCASCHIDGRMDQLAWDLGDPQGALKALNQTCLVNCGPWHPMKGPMTTQTLFGIIGPGVGGLHWRADREDLAAFNVAFPGLLGADAQLTADELGKFTAFISTLTFPPNPHRNTDNSLRNALFNGGNPAAGQTLFTTAPIDGGFATCNSCHALPIGTNGVMISGMALQESQPFKIPHLRNMYEKTGFFRASLTNNRAFGFLHDGSVSTLVEFLQSPLFLFPAGAAGLQQRRDLEAFMFSFPTGTHAAVGAQTTVIDSAVAPPQQLALIDTLLAQADLNAIGVIVKGRQGGLQRGYRYNGAGLLQSDRASETVSIVLLKALAVPGSELTWTAVPAGSQTRTGIDRDLDGFFDRDERDARSDPADPASVPLPLCLGNSDSSAGVDFNDVLVTLANFGADYGELTGPGDADGNGLVNFTDILTVLANFGAVCP